jgi:sRNA-binding protein
VAKKRSEPDPVAPAPLAVGVHKQMYPLIERIGISRRFLRDFLRSWTRSEAYRQALVEPEAWRYNVDGSAAAPVSPSEAEQAREQMERRADS